MNTRRPNDFWIIRAAVVGGVILFLAVCALIVLFPKLMMKIVTVIAILVILLWYGIRKR